MEMAATSQGYQQVDTRLWAGYAFTLAVALKVDGFDELRAARSKEKQAEAYAKRAGLPLEEYLEAALKVKTARLLAREAGKVFRETGEWPEGYEGRKRTCYKLPEKSGKKPRKAKGEFVPWRKKGSGKPKE
jgi:hypothetical protein